MLLLNRAFISLSALLSLSLTHHFVLGSHPTTTPNPIGDAYAPSTGPCPHDFTLIRTTPPPSGSLNNQEVEFIGRKKNLGSLIQGYLHNLQGYANKTNLTLPTYLTPNKHNTAHNLVPRIGVAISGGGYRAGLFGLSFINTIDGRNDTSNSFGTGGILQASLYTSGLSGGSWALSALVQSNLQSIPSILLGPSTPNHPSRGPGSLSPPYGDFGGLNAQTDIIPSSNASFLLDLVTALEPKSKIFPVSFNDFWSLGLARHFINGTAKGGGDYFDDSGNAGVHGAAVKFSDVAKL